MSRAGKVLVGILAVAVAALLALQTPLLRAARDAAWRVWVGSVARVAGIGPLQISGDVLTQLQRLQIENIRLRAELHDYETLRRQLGSTSFAAMRAIPALIAARPVDTFRTQAILNRGAGDGVTLHAPVVVQGSVLVGYVTELSEHTAVLQLLLHPATAVAAEVVDAPGGRGLLRGRSYTSLELSTVPRDASVQIGQAVVTAGHDTTPPGLLIGTIDTIRNEKNEAYQEARLTLPYEPEVLEAVVILVAP